MYEVLTNFIDFRKSLKTINLHFPIITNAIDKNLKKTDDSMLVI